MAAVREKLREYMRRFTALRVYRCHLCCHASGRGRAIDTLRLGEQNHAVRVPRAARCAHRWNLTENGRWFAKETYFFQCVLREEPKVPAVRRPERTERAVSAWQFMGG